MDKRYRSVYERRPDALLDKDRDGKDCSSMDFGPHVIQDYKGYLPGIIRWFCKGSKTEVNGQPPRFSKEVAEGENGLKVKGIAGKAKHK